MIQNQISCEAKNYNKQTKKLLLWLTWARWKNEIKELNHCSSSPWTGWYKKRLIIGSRFNQQNEKSTSN